MANDRSPRARISGSIGAGPPGPAGPGANAFVFRPGGSAGGAVYTTWPTLMAAVGVLDKEAVKFVTVDDSIAPAHVTAGAWNVENIHFVGDAADSETLIFDNNAVFVFSAIWLENGIVFNQESTAPVFTSKAAANPFANIYMVGNGTTIIATGEGPAAWAEVQAGGILNVFAGTGSFVGDGTHNVLQVDAGSLIVALGGGEGIGAILRSHALSGAGTAVLGLSAEASFQLPQDVATLTREYNFAQSDVWVVGNQYAGVDPTGTADSGPGLNLAAAAAAGGTLYLEGNYLLDTTVVLANNTDVVCAPGTTFTGTIAGSAPESCFFLAQPSATLGTTTLASNAVLFASTVSVTAVVLASGTIAAGMWIELANVPIGPIYRGAAYKVLAVSGSGPYTVTLDRPMKYVFSAADSVSLIASVPQNIHFYGGGCAMTGAVVRYFEFVSARDCSIEDVNVNPSGGTASDYAMSFDVAGYRSHYRRVNVDGGGVSTGGLRFESDESCGAEACFVKGCVEGGFQLLDGVCCTIDAACGASQNAYGITLGSQDVVIERGCNWCKVGGNWDANTDYGIFITAGTTYTACSGFTCNGNGLIGLYLDGTGALMNGNVFANGAVQNNGTYGVEVIAGTKGTVLDGLDLSNNGTYNALVTDDCLITNLRVRDAASSTATPLLINGTGNVVVSGFDIQDAGSGSLGIAVVGTATAEITDGVSRVGAGNNGIYVGATAVVKLARLTVAPIAGHAGEVGLSLNSATCTMRIGDGVDASACQTPFSNAGAGFVNRFLQALAGAATTTVSWPNIHATDNVFLEIEAKAGTLEAPYQVVITPGTGFVITPLGAAPSLDTSTLQVVIA